MKAPCTRLALACLWAVWWFGGGVAVSQQTADRDFQATVADPAYKDLHPKVLFDEAHYNVHTTGGSYKTFVDLVTSDGYQVTANDKPFEGKLLAGYDILVIANARGAPRPSEKPAFTDAECDAVRDWVHRGGALLLVTDHYPTGHSAENLGKRFGVDMSKGTTTDRAHAPPGALGGVLIFSRDDNLLGDHPITRGRNESERINRVATFTGQSLKGPEHAAALLKFSDTAVDRLPSGEGNGSGQTGRAQGRRRPAADTDVPTVSAAGRSQGLAFPFGQGRAVVLGEASQISAQQAGPLQRPMGMNYPTCDNRQWTLNIMHWLSGLLGEPVPLDGTLPPGRAEEPADRRPPPASRQLPSARRRVADQTPILLTGPADWRFERISLPPRFAPDVKLSGFGEARFAPGMFDTEAPDYFTYVLAFSVEDAEVIDAAAIKDLLEKYYQGLSAAVGRRKQLAPDFSQINAVVTPAKSGEAAGSSYEAKLPYFDTFNDGRKIVLNLQIKVVAHPDAKKTIVTLLISPKPLAADVWKKLHEIEKTIHLDGT